MTQAALQSRIEAERRLAQAICGALDRELAEMGFPRGEVAVAGPGTAVYRLERDPSSGQDSLVGIWRNAEGGQCGQLLFHADGSFFAEYDVIRAHPCKPQWFVEAVTAWGRGATIKSEPRLLPMVG